MEEILKTKGYLVVAPVGFSMLPLIRQKKDVVALEKIVGRAKKNDIILYKRKNGKYVLHRVIEVRTNDYVLCGDNQYTLEYGICDEQVLAVLKEFYRGEHLVSLSKWWYQIYVKVWCFYIPMRKVILVPYNLGRRIVHRLVRN